MVVITLENILNEKGRLSFFPGNSSATRMRPNRPWRQWLTTSLTGPLRTKLLTALLPGNPIILARTKSGSTYEI